MGSRLLLSALIALIISFAGPARAVPTMSTLNDVLTTSPTIVIAKVHGASASGYELDVERALRGKASGALLVKLQSGTTVPYAVGTRLVAFVAAGDTWYTAGVLAAGPTLETGVIHVEGLPACCDAHIVIPNVLTLSQLEDVIKGTPLAWTFRGKIVVAGPTGPTPTTIDVVATTTAAATAGAGTVSGMPTMVGFPAPTVQVGGPDRDVTVSWSSTASRPLRLVGIATGKNADGSIAVDYRVDAPHALTEAELRKYLADGALAYPYYTLEIALTSGAKMTVTLGKDVGRVGEITTATGKVPISGLSMAPTRDITSSAGVLTLDPRRAGLTLQRTGAEGELIQELHVSSIGCSWATGTKPPQACTLSLVGTSFARR